MRFFTRSLFWKIFLWFWATVLAVAISMALTFVLGPQRKISPWHASLLRTAHYSGAAALDVLHEHGTGAVSSYMHAIGDSTHMRACLADDAGAEIAGYGCGLFTQNILLVSSKRDSNISVKEGMAYVVLPIQNVDGKKYIYAVEIPIGGYGFNKAGIATRLAVAFLVSFCVCYLLTRYLTAPILRLRDASIRLAAGELSSRASKSMERRNDELGFLVRDFNAMAARIEDLMSRQRQLIYDISHELRSPLARLTVALDLARERKGADSAFEHMEQDIERMGDMVGRMLTVAKLETSSADIEMSRIDLGALLAEIVRNAAFEVRERENAIQFTLGEPCFVRGNADMLRSAIENVVRNAIRYTGDDTSIEIYLQRAQKTKGFVHLSIRDYGPGVPESELSNIFRPFYRIAGDRDRQSGGAGLGLAIADRIVQVHGGTIHASNSVPHGLLVDIFLPEESHAGPAVEPERA